MTALDRAVSPADAMHGVIRIVPWLFAATLSVSAFLLFSIQPMFTKMVLPLLGGAPTVWSIALVFFQATLLCGYTYAHLIVRRVPLRVGALIHLGTLAAAAAMLPIGEVAGANLGTAGCARRSPTPGAQEGDGRR